MNYDKEYEDYQSQSSGEETVKCQFPGCGKMVLLKELSPLVIKVNKKRNTIGACPGCVEKYGG